MSRLDDLLQLMSGAEEACIPWPYTVYGRRGYLWVGGRERPAHVVACELTHGSRPDRMEAAHSCGNHSCINPHHLRWATHQENAADRLLLGERTGRQKLTPEQVADIRRAGQTETQRAVASRFGIGQSQVQRILAGVSWRTPAAFPTPTTTKEAL